MESTLDLELDLVENIDALVGRAWDKGVSAAAILGVLELSKMNLYLQLEELGETSDDD